MNKSLVSSLVALVLLPSFILSQDLSPTLSIRYEDFINNLTPVVAIGVNLKIDNDRYTGFETNTSGTDTRLLMGWNWGVIGLGSITADDGNIYPHYTFGVSYEILNGLYSNFEYVMTPDPAAGIEDHLRLALSISF